MPHVDLKFTSDLNIDATAFLVAVEKVIHGHDSNTGECKGRAYPADEFNHTHCLLEISMLTKSYRDSAYTQDLLAKLKAEMENQIGQKCFLSLGITYTGDSYITTEFVPTA
jgi:hypothetical protein